jgi:4-carboxymuconolactone decarboxylase
MAEDERRRRGLELRKRLFGGNDAPNLADPLIEVTIDHLFGDVWTRPGLELRDRSLITCAALVALGKEAQLKVHLRGLLNQGMSRQGIEEMMIHLAHYASASRARCSRKPAPDGARPRGGPAGFSRRRRPVRQASASRRGRSAAAGYGRYAVACREHAAAALNCG